METLHAELKPKGASQPGGRGVRARTPKRQSLAEHSVRAQPSQAH